MPGRSPNRVELSQADRTELEHRAACYTRPHREVIRAKMILAAAGGESNTEIGKRFGFSREAVGRWRRRFCEHGLDGLDDQARPGRPRRFPPGADRRGQGARLRASKRGRPALTPLNG